MPNPSGPGASRAARVEVEILILALDGPIRGDLVLNAAASNPAASESPRRLSSATATEALFDVAISETAGRHRPRRDQKCNPPGRERCRTSPFSTLAGDTAGASVGNVRSLGNQLPRRTRYCRAARCSRFGRRRSRRQDRASPTWNAGSIRAVATVHTDVQAAPVHADVGNVFVATRGRTVHVGCVSGCASATTLAAVRITR